MSDKSTHIKIVFGILATIGVLLVLFGLFYNKFYMNISNDIVQGLYKGQDYKQYEAFIVGFINGGTIQPLSKFTSYSISIFGMIIVYLSGYYFVNSSKIDNFKKLITLDYWSTFFAIKEKEVYVSEERLAEIKNQQKLIKQRKLDEILKSKKENDEPNQDFLNKIRKK